MSFNMSDIREKLTETLPDYMIPSQFIELGNIPLTSNGKVNKRALPEPETAIKLLKINHGSVKPFMK